MQICQSSILSPQQMLISPPSSPPSFHHHHQICGLLVWSATSCSLVSLLSWATTTPRRTPTSAAYPSTTTARSLMIFQKMQRCGYGYVWCFFKIQLSFRILSTPCWRKTQDREWKLKWLVKNPPFYSSCVKLSYFGGNYREIKSDDHLSSAWSMNGWGRWSTSWATPS